MNNVIDDLEEQDTDDEDVGALQSQGRDQVIAATRHLQLGLSSDVTALISKNYPNYTQTELVEAVRIYKQKMNRVRRAHLKAVYALSKCLRTLDEDNKAK